MTPHRIFAEHPAAVSYFRVAVISLICAIGTTLYNNERTDERVNSLATKAAEAGNYAHNYTTCGAYKLVNPTIESNNALIVSLKRYVKDPPKGATKKMIEQNKTRLAKVRIQNKAFKSYKNIYTTIPIDFDCAKLPKTPPK